MARNRKGKGRRRKRPTGRRHKSVIPRLPYLQRVPGHAWALVAGLAAMVSLLQFCPWLAVGQGAQVDERNPYSTLFFISNEGYLPVVDLTAVCTSSFATDTGTHFDNNQFHFGRFADYLAHSQKASLPCVHMLGLGPKVGTISPLTSIGTLTVTVTYSLYPFSSRWFKFLRKHQAFRFKPIEGPNHTYYWTYTG